MSVDSSQKLCSFDETLNLVWYGMVYIGATLNLDSEVLSITQYRTEFVKNKMVAQRCQSNIIDIATCKHLRAAPLHVPSDDQS